MRSIEERIRMAVEEMREDTTKAQRGQGERLQLGEAEEQREETRSLSTSEQHIVRKLDGEGRRNESEESTQEKCKSRPKEDETR